MAILKPLFANIRSLQEFEVANQSTTIHALDRYVVIIAMLSRIGVSKDTFK